jgi:hypothetical protein
MGTSSPRSAPILSAAHLTGRLTPLALDNAHLKADVLLTSVTVAGLSQAQIDSVPPGPERLFRRLQDAKWQLTQMVTRRP